MRPVKEQLNQAAIAWFAALRRLGDETLQVPFSVKVDVSVGIQPGASDEMIERTKTMAAIIQRAIDIAAKQTFPESKQAS